MSLERNIILATRNQYRNESQEEYLNCNNIIKPFVVLKEYNDKLLVIPLRQFKKGDRLKLQLSQEYYPYLYKDSISVNVVDFINKNQIVEIAYTYLSNLDFSRLVTRLSFSAFEKLTNKEKIEAYKFIKETNEKKIKPGSIVNIKDENTYKIYFVTKVLEHDFEGYELKYNAKTGMKIIEDTKYIIPLDSLTDNLFYVPEVSENFNAKLKLMKNVK